MGAVHGSEVCPSYNVFIDMGVVSVSVVFLRNLQNKKCVCFSGIMELR